MASEVFISYSSKDQVIAQATCANLEAGGIQCWMAPRDIQPGTEWGAAIIDALDRCRAVVLIFSASANSSPQIHREIERAVSRGVPIVPVRIESILPTESMAYFMESVHWLDAMSLPLEPHLQRLSESLKSLLEMDSAAAAAAPLAPGHPPSLGPQAGTKPEPAAHSAANVASMVVQSERRTMRVVLRTIAITAIVVLIAFGLLFLFAMIYHIAESKGTNAAAEALMAVICFGLSYLIYRFSLRRKVATGK